MGAAWGVLMATLRERIADLYPDLLPLLRIPEVASLLTQAVSTTNPLSPTAFQSKLRATKWFRSMSESQRRLWITQQSDPATFRTARDSYRVALDTAARAFGAVLSRDQLNWLAMEGLGKGWEPGGQEMLFNISQLVSKGAVKAGPGARRTNARDAQQMARRDFFYRMSNRSAAIWGDRVARGVATMDDVRTAVADKAKQMFPHFSTGLSQGFTMYELTDNYRQIIAEELELDPERIDLSTGRWSKVLSKRGSDGKIRPMTNFEVLQAARQDPRWWNTGHGKQQDAEWANNMLAMFGRRAPLGGG